MAENPERRKRLSELLAEVMAGLHLEFHEQMKAETEDGKTAEQQAEDTHERMMLLLKKAYPPPEITEEDETKDE